MKHGLMHGISSAKAKKMLKENKARGKKLSTKQKRFFGLIAGGGKPKKRK